MSGFYSRKATTTITARPKTATVKAEGASPTAETADINVSPNTASVSLGSSDVFGTKTYITATPNEASIQFESKTELATISFTPVTASGTGSGQTSASTTTATITPSTASVSTDTATKTVSASKTTITATPQGVGESDIKASKTGVSVSPNTATIPADSLTWETETDWDSGTAEVGVVHESTTNTDYSDATVLKKGYTAASPTPNANLHAYYPCHEDTTDNLNDFGPNGYDSSDTFLQPGQTGLVDTTTYLYDGGDEYANLPAWGTLGSSLTNDVAFAFWFKRGSSQSNSQIIWGESGTSGTGTQLDIKYEDDSTLRWSLGETGGNSIYVTAPASWSDDNWHHYVCQKVGGNTASDMEVWEDGTQLSATIQTDESFSNVDDFNDSTTHFMKKQRNGGFVPSQFCNAYMGEVRIYKDGALSSSEIQDLYDAVQGSSTFTSDIRTLGSSQPDLTNLDYTLNGGGIDVTVVGSPGTGSEERVTQTLDGNTSYSLSWNSDHADFQIELDITTPDPTSTPSVNSVTVEPLSTATVSVSTQDVSVSPNTASVMGDGPVVVSPTTITVSPNTASVGGSVATPEASVTATLNGKTVNMTVFEDTDNNGVADNIESFSVSDGTNTYTLDSFAGGTGNDYWWYVEYTGSDVNSAALIDEVDVTV